MSKSHLADRSRERRLKADFLAFLQDKGLPLSEQNLSILRTHKLLEKKPLVQQEEGEIKLDIQAEEHHLTIGEYLSRISMNWKTKWKDQEITREDWAPESIEKHTPEFIAFITSHIPRFDLLLAYEPFYLYLEQARRWMQEPESYADQITRREKLEYGAREYQRCRQNRLYALDKYVWIKEGQQEGGKRKYIASCPQAFLLFILDCKYSFLLGKGRQAAITSTLCPAFLMQAICRRSQHILLIAGSDEQVQNIFEDKVRYTFGEMASWFRPEAVYSRKGKGIQFGDEEGEKGAKTAHGSKFVVKPPSVSAANSGSPDIVGVDEAADAPDFSKMIFEVEPTLVGEKDGKVVSLRQLACWSTGIPEGRGKGEFERELRTLVDKWRSGITGKLIPLFFNWTCRPGVTAADREKARISAETGGSMAQNEQTREERMAQWRMHWPRDLDDMFSVSHRTLIPTSSIRAFIDKMDEDFSKNPLLRPKIGWFKPLLDVNQPLPEGSFYPYKCIGATFVPSSDTDNDAPVQKFLDPQSDYLNRYWQGTDPLINNTGTSRMASAILDSRENDDTTNIYPTIACLVNHRDTRDINITYEQVALMGLYYGNAGKCCPELVESNLSKGYVMFKEAPAFAQGNSWVWNKELPEELQTGRGQKVNHIGLDNHQERKEYVIRYLKQFLNMYGGNIKFYQLWSQVRTFALSYTDSGTEKWKTVDYKQHQDDILFAVAFAYICRLAFPERKTMKIEQLKQQHRIESVWMRDHNGVKYRAEQRVPLYVQ